MGPLRVTSAVGKKSARRAERLAGASRAGRWKPAGSALPANIILLLTRFAGHFFASRHPFLICDSTGVIASIKHDYETFLLFWCFVDERTSELRASPLKIPGV